MTPRSLSRVAATVALAIGPVACAPESRAIVFDDVDDTTSPSFPSETVTDADTEASDPVVRGRSDVPVDSAPSSVIPSSPSTTSPSTTAPPLPASEVPTLIEWRGERRYIHGANLPWVNFGCDFGCGDDGGVSSPEGGLAALDVIQQAADAGMTHVRWWLFPDPQRAFEIDADGGPLRLRPAVFDDLDAALDIADYVDVQLVLTLFAGPTQLPASWMTDDEHRGALVKILRDLFVRYANHPHIMTWQVMNEPEWQVWAGHVSIEPVHALVRDVADAVHSSTDALVSVGAARLDGLPLWTDVGLDYLTVHWYDNMQQRSECAPCATVAELRSELSTDLPILIGEFPLTGSDPLGRLQLFADDGYAGAMAWSLMPGRTADAIPLDFAAAAAFVPPSGTGIPIDPASASTSVEPGTSGAGAVTTTPPPGDPDAGPPTSTDELEDADA